MRFTQREIRVAHTLKSLGLEWKPSLGQYVYDTSQILPQGSPFQDRVYYLLNLSCFLEKVGGQEKFLQLMTWLPTWDEARAILRSLGVADTKVQNELTRKKSLADRTERVTLFEMIERQLRMNQRDTDRCRCTD